MGRARRQPSLNIVPVAESVVERLSGIMGEHSASAQALAELHRRRAAGEDVALFRAPGMMLVGPAPAAPPPGGRGAGPGTGEGEG